MITWIPGLDEACVAKDNYAKPSASTARAFLSTFVASICAYLQALNVKFK